MKLTEYLYEEAKAIWEGYLTQPFLAELAQGTLSQERFRYYMVQDYVYLLEYAKVFALGVAKSRDEEVMRHLSGMLYSTLNEEMGIHKQYMDRLGITKKEVAAARPALSNRSYTSYMLEVAYREDVLGVLAAILSCAWSYQKIGTALAARADTLAHPFYGEWVASYAGTEYQESVDAILLLTDHLGESVSQKRWAELAEVFRVCSQYEALFWDMAYAMEPTC